MDQANKQEKMSSYLIDFRVSYKLPKRADLEFFIEPLKASDAGAAIKLTTDIYTQHEVTTSALGLTWEESNIYISFKISKSAELQTGIIVREKNSQHVVALLTCEDLAIPSDFEAKARQVSPSYMEKGYLYGEYLDANKNNFYEKPEKPFQTVEFSTFVVAEEYQGLGIATRMFRFLTEEHPLVKRVDRYVAFATSARSSEIMRKCGCILLQGLPYDKWEVNGKKVFPNMEEIQEKNNLVRTESMQVWGFERKKEA